MAYSDFTLDDLKATFGLRVEEQTDLFSSVNPVNVSALLRESLQENVPLAFAIGTEKAKSEMIIAPVLLEVRRQCQRKIGLFSGIDFPVDADKGLRGPCDFLLSLSAEQYTLEAPLVAVVEAKNDNIKQGISQCLATMVGAQLFNQRRQKPLPAVFGVVTTGHQWKFLRLSQADAAIDVTDYFIKEVERVVGILVYMINQSRNAGTN